MFALRKMITISKHRPYMLLLVVVFIMVAFFFMHHETATQILGCAPHPPHVLTMYNDLAYPLRTPDLSVDAIISTFNATTGRLDGIVLCRRGKQPHKMCIPGGYVQYGESVEAAVIREVEEETGILLLQQSNGKEGLKKTSMRQFRVFSNPLRDDRRHTVSVSFDIEVRDGQMPRAADDVKDCSVMSLHRISMIPSHEFAFDHYDMLRALIFDKQY